MEAQNQELEALNRQRSMRYREFGLYAPRTVTPQQPIYVSENSAEAPPQIPPLAPLSTRWESLSHGSIFVNSPLKTSFESVAEEDEPQMRCSGSDHQLEAFPPEPPSTFARHEYQSRSTPQSPTKAQSMEGRPRADSAQLVKNFSRPRKPLGRQQLGHELGQRIRTSSPEGGREMAPMQVGSRSRGQSSSSAKSMATFASMPAPPTMEDRDLRALRSRDGPATRFPVSYRGDPHPPGQTREGGAPWLSAEEARSSIRSQWTDTTTPGTNATERSSVLTKASSRTSLFPIDEPSVEDVMGMYEMGFGDDEYQSEIGSRPATAWSESNHQPDHAQNSRFGSNTMPTLPIPTPSNGHVVRDSTAMFSHSGLPASLPRDISPARFGRSTPSRRESVRSLDVEEFQVVQYSDRDSLTDRYGFKKENHYLTKDQYDIWNDGYSEYLARRRKKWSAYLRESGLMTDRPNRFPPKSNKTKRFIRKGIPPDWRGSAWFYYAGGPALLARNSGVYDDLVQQKAKDSDVEIIERDLHRTFPDNIRFKPQGNAPESADAPSDPDALAPEMPIIASLRRVLHAFSIYHPKIGYCQSLNFIAGLLLLFVPSEEQCFWLLNIITQDYLPGTHEMSLEGSKVDLGVLMTSLEEAMPSIWSKISCDLEDTTTRPQTAKSIKKSKPRKKLVAASADRLPPITMSCTAWFMSCFIGSLPIETTLRVWDVLFYEGPKTLFRIALAIFKTGEAEIEAVSDPMEMFSVVQTMPRRLIDANLLMEACFKRRNGFGHLSQETTEARRQERRLLIGLDNTVKSQETQTDGNVTDAEAVVGVRRKGTLFGRKRKDVLAQRAAEV